VWFKTTETPTIHGQWVEVTSEWSEEPSRTQTSQRLRRGGAAHRNPDVLSQYSGPGANPAWTVNTETKAWTRNINGIGGGLVATQTNNETPVLQIANLHGDIVATTAALETSTGLSTKTEQSEFGVPTTSTPAQYSWLGALGLPTDLPSGVMTMGVRSYVPQLGRFLQPDPIEGGSANRYSYTDQDPIDTSDPTGEYVVEGNYIVAAENASDDKLTNEEQEREAAARAAAERAAREAAEAADQAGPQWGEEEWAEEGGTEEEYEVAYHPKRGNKTGPDEVKVQAAVLFTPLAEGQIGGEGAQRSAVVPLCEPGRTALQRPCALRVLRFHWHWHWWGVSVALSRHDMAHLSEAAAGIAGAVGLTAPYIAAALSVGSVETGVLLEQDKCYTLWLRWAPPEHYVKPETCYG